MNEINHMNTGKTHDDSEHASGRMRRLIIRKFILLLLAGWMIPFWLLAQCLRALLCITTGIQHLWWNPIEEAMNSWDANA